MPEAKDDLKREKVRIVPISNIEDFPDHPFQVKDDESMDQLVESIRMNGVLNPVIALKIDENHYQLISGHRRKRACILLGIDRIPLIGRELSKEEAVIEMVDSNLQREHILPSEKARAYKMKMEAMKQQGKRTDLTSSPLGTKLRTDEIIAQEAGESRNQIQRYIRLNELIPELLEFVDEGKIGMRPAVELSYLQEDEMRDLVDFIDDEEVFPSHAQTIRMKALSKEGKLDTEAIRDIILAEAVERDLPYEIKCPALLICGEQDHAGSCVRYNKAWHKNTGIPLEWIKDAGHNSNTDQPKTVNRLIEKFANAAGRYL